MLPIEDQIGRSSCIFEAVEDAIGFDVMDGPEIKRSHDTPLGMRANDFPHSEWTITIRSIQRRRPAPFICLLLCKGFLLDLNFKALFSACHMHQPLPGNDIFTVL